MVIAKRYTQDMLKEATTCKVKLIYNDEQSVNKIVECKLEANTIRYMNFNSKIIILFLAIQGMGDIISSKIVSSSEFKITVDSNKVFQTLENDVRI